MIEFVTFYMGSGIETVVTNLFKMFFWNVANQSFDEIYRRKSFFHIFIIFMTVVVKGYSVIDRIIVINARGGDDRSAKISSDVLFNYMFWVTTIWSCVDIEAILAIFINPRNHLLEGIWKFLFEFIQ